MKNKRLFMNLQFFGEEGENNGGNNDGDSGMGSNSGATGDNNNDNTNDSTEIDVEALAGIISDKDKVIEQLQQDVTKLKRSNAELLIKVNAGHEQVKSIEETILSFCDTRAVSRLTD